MCGSYMKINVAHLENTVWEILVLADAVFGEACTGGCGGCSAVCRVEFWIIRFKAKGILREEASSYVLQKDFRQDTMEAQGLKTHGIACGGAILK